MVIPRAVALALVLPASGTAVRSDSALVIGVQSRQDTVFVGEPVVLDVSFENTSADTVFLAAPLAQLDHTLHIQIWIQSEDGARYWHETSTGVAYIMVDALPLAPGETVQSTHTIGGSWIDGRDPRRGVKECGPRSDFCWDFPEAGVYEVGVVYKSRYANKQPHLQHHLEAGPIAIVVLEPANAMDRLGLVAWADALPALVAWRGANRGGHYRHDKDAVVRTLEGFLTEPLTRSVYAPYARYLCALSSSSPGVTDSHLEELRRRFPGFVLTDEVLLDLAHVKRQLGDHDKAETLTIRARGLNPTNIRAHSDDAGGELKWR